MKLSTAIDPAKNHCDIVFEVDAEIALTAKWLVRYFEEQVAAGVRFHEGQIVQMGWMVLQLKASSTNLELWEPDFNTVPIRWCRSVNNTLRHLALQRSICDTLSCEPDFPSLRQAGIVSPHFHSSAAFTMSRAEPAGSDSGWAFSELGYSGTEGAFASLYQIAIENTIVVPFLALPTGASLCVQSGQIDICLGGAVISSKDNALLLKLATKE
jgi:hypothetical protein